jgi:cell division transport system permease protein
MARPLPLGLKTQQESRFLPEGRLSGPMPWVIAVMMFLTVLAAAAGLSLFRTANGIGTQLAGRVTVQISEGNPERRAALVRSVKSSLDDQPFVRAVRPVDEVELRSQLRQWLGQDGLDADLPIPALIDVDLVPSVAPDQAMGRLRSILATITPQARVEPHSEWLGPVARLIRFFGTIAGAVVGIMLLAMTAILALAARSSARMHEKTLGLLHLVGATDAQIIRLFQRRLALDAAFGGAIGFATAAAVLAVVSLLFRDIQGAVFAGSGLGWTILMLPILPVLGIILAILTARFTIRALLKRQIG